MATNHNAAGSGTFPPIEGIPTFWSDLRVVPATALLLDYDGTLAPFRVDPLEARPMDGVLPALRRIVRKTDTFVAIVSGRPVAEVKQLLGGLVLTIVGSHGWEALHPGRALAGPETTAAQSALLDAAEHLASPIAGRARTERKLGSVAVHVRGRTPDEAEEVERAVREAWQALEGETALSVRRFNGGVELRLQGMDKGAAIVELLAHRADHFAVYLGDDDTDEDAFRVIPRWGVGIRVGRPAESLAAGRLDQSQVPAFLEGWAEVRGGPGRG